jgi:hypothetical protein
MGQRQRRRHEIIKSEKINHNQEGDGRARASERERESRQYQSTK